MTEHYCIYCKRAVELTEEGRCCDCGGQLENTDTAEKFYISQPQQGSALTINLEPGQKLFNGKYTIIKLIGKGSCKVYLAEDSQRSGPAALKVIPLVFEDPATQLKRRFESWRKVDDYTHVDRLYDVLIIPYEGVVLLLVSTEYADGGTFRQWLIQNKDNACKRQTEGLFYLKQAFRGVESLHAADLVYGNLKPESLAFVDGTLKVMDMGLSRHMRDIQRSGYNNQQLGPEISPGRLKYSSPEQNMTVRDGDIDIRSDIYSLGVILYETCNPKSRLPFESTYHQLHLPAPVLENAGVNAARVVARCLQKAPTDRYETITQLIDDLETGSPTETPRPSDVDTGQSTEAVQEMWDKACEFMDTGNLNEAGRLCDRILSVFPEYNQARGMRDEIDSKFQQAKQFYETIKNGIGNQSFSQLLTLLDEAIQLFPDHPDGHLVQIQLQSVAGEFKNAMDKGDEAFGEGHWQQAQRNFKRARELNPGSAHIEDRINFVGKVSQQVEAARANIDTAIQRQDWNKAMSLARNVDRYIDEIKSMVQ